jgi:hypothetical protein
MAQANHVVTKTEIFDADPDEVSLLTAVQTPLDVIFEFRHLACNDAYRG